MKAFWWMLAMTALGVLLVITGIFLDVACSNVDAQHLTSKKERTKPSLGLSLDGDSLILEGFFNRAVTGVPYVMPETMYNPAGCWYDCHYDMLNQIANGEEINVILKTGTVLRFKDERYWVEFIGAGLHLRPRPKAGDVDGNGVVDEDDIRIVIDIVLGILV